MGLTLSRSVGEEVVMNLGGEIVVITVRAVNKGDKVKLNIQADRSVSIHRREVADQIDEWKAPLEKLAAAS